MSGYVRSVKVTVTGVDDVLGDIADLERCVSDIDSGLASKLADACAKTAESNWKKAALEDVNGAPLPRSVGSVSISKAEDGFDISVSGDDVAFLEFGAGVHYNGAESYPGERPAGIVGIGQFGKGKGKKDKWKYRGKGGKSVTTHGNRAYAPMFRAAKTTERKVYKIAREIVK